MKVLCINAKNSIPLIINEGEVYTVAKVDNNSFGVPAYFLEETGPKTPYSADRFIPLSSISETEFSRNYNAQTA